MLVLGDGGFLFWKAWLEGQSSSLPAPTRRALLGTMPALVGWNGPTRHDPSSARQGAVKRAAAERSSLATVPLELHGDWGASLPVAAMAVMERMRAACLSGVPLRSDRQPTALRVDNHLSGPPAIWLHFDDSRTAWIIVDIGERQWCRLAYQFGHELGHVLCNSWQPDARPQPPCQWIEEILVETFSIRGLARLADDWARDPPFSGDQAYAAAIRSYRQDLVDAGSREAAVQGVVGADLSEWFHVHRDELENGGLAGQARPATPTILAAYEADPACVADLGALNRWKKRSSVSITEYLRLWRRSCQTIGTGGTLPELLARSFGVER
jgi:hypothetical protein